MDGHNIRLPLSPTVWSTIKRIQVRMAPAMKRERLEAMASMESAKPGPLG